MKLTSTNPSRNFEVIGSVNVSTEKDIIASVTKARKTFSSWSATPLSERKKKLRSFIDISQKRSEEIARLISLETGRPITSARGNVRGGIEYFEAYLAMAERYLSPAVTVETSSELHRVYREPRGVVAAILPWNYPFMNVVWQCGQALIAGNTIVYKNSSEDPLFSKLLDDLIRASDIPDGVFTVIYGGSKAGEFLARQDVDMISFTGSTEVGRQLTRIAAEKFIPIVTELGGSTPVIVFEDMDVTDQLVSYLVHRRFKNAGQACDAMKRLIVHRSIYPALLKKMVSEVAVLKVGDALNEDTVVGPLVAARQVDRLADQVADAKKKGAAIETGGGKPAGLRGAYYLPTVITGVTRDMRVWREETFGPVLPVVPFRDEEEAVRLANDTEYGLTAHILTHDKERFARMASRIEAGSIGQNEIGFWNPENPFGGYKKSGMGRTHGPFGFAEVTNIKVVAEEK
ncbi:aldehyde dehydrogenase family protein [Patescibacteria group bacterium]|nr:aldehyde dehydrogenase family protein [Patescibacteria group bacterium]